MTPPRPDDESQRIEALRRFDVLDTPAEQAFDDLARLASQICGTSMAFVSFLDTDREWLKANVGTGLVEIPRDNSVSAHAVLEEDLFVVTDLASDARFAANPLVVSEPHARFYAGVPLRTGDGFALGTLCVLDQTPRALTPTQADALRTLARQAMAQLELRRQTARRGQAVEEARATNSGDALMRELFIDSTTNAVVTLDATGRFTLVNRRACEIAGRTEDDLLGRAFTDLLTTEESARLAGRLRSVLVDGAAVDQAEATITRPDGSTQVVAWNAAPIWVDGAIAGVAATAEDITERKRSQSLIAAQGTVLELVAANGALDEILQAIVKVAEAHTATVCSLLLVDADGVTLRRGAAPSLPEELAAALDGLLIGPAAGSCGTAAYRRAPVLSRDMQNDPLWAHLRDATARLDLRAAWSTPIMAPDGRVLATLALYAREVRLPNEWEMRVIDLLTALTGLAIQRTRAHQHLIDSESRYRALAENTFDTVCELDSLGRFAYASPNFKLILGYDASEMIGRVAFELIHEDDRARVGQQFADAMADPEPGTISFRFLRRDGGWTWLEASANIFVNDAGEQRAVIVSRDIAERTAMEATLRESEEKLRTLVGNAPLVLFGTDAAGVFTSFDGKGVELLGLTRGQYVGQSIFEAMATFPDITGGTRRALTGETVTYIFRVNQIALEIHQSPVRDGADEIAGTIGLVINVSERMRVEDELRSSEERYRAIYEAPGVVRLLVDPETGSIVEANPAASNFYGYTVDEMAGMPISTISTSPPPEIQESLRRKSDGAASVVYRVHRLRSGELRDVELFGAPVEVDGRKLLYGLVQDITERRWAESLVSAQRQLLEMVAVGAPLVDVLTQLASTFEDRAPGALCSVLLLSPDGTQLRHAAAPSLPQAYADAIDGVAIGPSVGSCGTAAYLRREVIVEDIASDPLWTDFRGLALSHGLRSCWSTPILSATGEVLATFAVYHREPGGVRDRERSLIEIATHVAGIAIEQERAEVAVRSRTEELERMYRRLAESNAELEESKQHLEEKSFLLERGLEQERERSRRDQLTGALNHAAITDAVREMIRADAGRSLAIAMVDVDGLKAANDTYGHQVGDAVLALVAQKLALGGAIVGRYGGDEFVAIVPGADRAAAERYREGVLASLAGARLIDEQTGAHIPVVASMGLAVYPEEAGAVDDLIRLSDSAMYASRRRRVADGGESSSRSLGSDRAAKMVGELVPLLTSAGGLDDKLRLVAHRLSVGAGYDAVNFVIAGLGHVRQASTAIPGVSEDKLEEWNRRQLIVDNRVVASLLLRTMKPLIIDDLETTEYVPESQKVLLIEAGLRSALASPMIWESKLIGVLTVASKQSNAFTLRDVEFIAAVATQVTAIVRMSSLVEELRTSTTQLQQAHVGTVMMLASAAEAHDHTTGRHLQRVQAITEAIARELGYDAAGADALGMAAILHDIGKIRVPDSVLGSSNSLAEAEWVLMKQHTLWGAAFLSEQPGFEMAASVARHHHERWDGAGYPDGLSGDEIPESAQSRPLLTASMR